MVNGFLETIFSDCGNRMCTFVVGWAFVVGFLITDLHALKGIIRRGFALLVGDGVDVLGVTVVVHSRLLTVKYDWAVLASN